MQEEMGWLKKNGVCEWESRVYIQNMIGCGWIYNAKYNSYGAINIYEGRIYANC